MTINEQTLAGSWNELKGRVREEWGDITSDELESAKGSVDRVVGLIQRKTGEGRGRKQAARMCRANMIPPTSTSPAVPTTSTTCRNPRAHCTAISV